MIQSDYPEIVVRCNYKGGKRKAHVPFEDETRPLCAVEGRTSPTRWNRKESTKLPGAFTDDCKRCLRIINDSK